MASEQGFYDSFTPDTIINRRSSSGDGPKAGAGRNGAAVCPFFAKTGSCSFADRCKFAHPLECLLALLSSAGNAPTVGPQAKSPTPVVGGTPEVCGYFVRTGTCAYGDRCKFQHPLHKLLALPTLNSQGYPMRPGCRDCPHYVARGFCSFSSSCKFNHPEPRVRGPTGNMPPPSSSAASSTRPSGSGTCASTSASPFSSTSSCTDLLGTSPEQAALLRAMSRASSSNYSNASAGSGGICQQQAQAQTQQQQLQHLQLLCGTGAVSASGFDPNNFNNNDLALYALLASLTPSAGGFTGQHAPLAVPQQALPAVSSVGAPPVGMAPSLAAFPSAAAGAQGCIAMQLPMPTASLPMPPFDTTTPFRVPALVPGAGAGGFGMMMNGSGTLPAYGPSDAQVTSALLQQLSLMSSASLGTAAGL